MRRGSLLLLMLLPGMVPVHGQVTGADMERLRTEMNRKRAERHMQDRADDLLRWRQVPRGPFTWDGRSAATVRLEHDMDDLAAVLTLTPIGSDEPPLRALLPRPTEQWVAVPKGRYRLSLTIGHPGWGQTVRLEPRAVRVDDELAYELVLDRELEEDIKRRWATPTSF